MTLLLEPRASIDLHMHTVYSDGHWRPENLFEHLARAGFSLVSVVDHDQLDHLPEVLALGKRFGVRVAPGTEVTAGWRGVAAHLLCLAPVSGGFTGDALRQVVVRTAERMVANTADVYAYFVRRGYMFPHQDEILATQGGKVIRAGDVARLLVEHGYVEGPAQAMTAVVEAGYQQVTAPLAEAVEAAHAGGAVCLLAHPGRGAGEIHRFEPEEIKEMLHDAPLDGIEAYYPTHTQAQMAAYEELAQRHGLLLAAGSDSHGPHQRLPIGYEAERVAPLLERLGVMLAAS